jgi:ATP synthase protein I
MAVARDARRTGSLVRTAVVLCLVAGVVSAIASTLAVGVDGLYGALVGTGVVLVFFGLGHVVLMMLRDIEPSMLLLVAMLTYLLQVVCLLAVFASFATWSGDISTRALGLTIIACTICWTVGLVLSSRRQRIPLFDLGGEAR